MAVLSQGVTLASADGVTAGSLESVVEHQPDPTNGSSGHAVGVHWLGGTAGRASVVGEEIASLSAMSAQFHVPSGFCVTVPPLVIGADGRLDGGEGVITDAYEFLVGRESDAGVDVRGSFLRPGQPAVSWVRRPRIFRNVVGAEAVVAAVTECLAPYVSARAEAYRRRHGGSEEPPGLAVLVARFIDADTSALVHTAGVEDETEILLVESTWGVAESLTDRTVQPDTYLVRRSDLTIMRDRVGTKETMMVPGNGGVSHVPVPARLRDRPCLANAEVHDLARIAVEAERRLGRSALVEVARRDDLTYVLWCGVERPHAGR